MADFFATPTGEGLKNGTSPANSFGAPEMYSFLDTTITGGDSLYALTGTYTNSLGTNITVPSGNVANRINIKGVTDLTLLTPAYGTDRPYFALGAYYFGGGGYINLKNIDALSSSISSCVRLGTFSTIENCNGRCTSTGAGLYITGSFGLILCSTGHSSSGSGINVVDSALIDTCVVNSGFNGINVGASSEAFNCIVNGVSNNGMQAVTEGRNIIGCTINNCGNAGIRGDFNGLQLLRNNNITSNPVGILSTTVGDGTIIDYCNFFGNTIDVSDDNGVTENNSYKQDTCTSLDPQYTNESGGDFSIGTNLKALGSPSDFPDEINKAYVDIGALQRPEPDPADYPENGEVAFSVVFDNGNRTGLRVDADPDNVTLDNGSFGDPSSPLVPNNREAPESKVQKNFNYGSNDSLTGALETATLNMCDLEIQVNKDDIEIEIN